MRQRPHSESYGKPSTLALDIEYELDDIDYIEIKGDIEYYA